MGAGKSTVGRLLAELCGRTFVDLDEEIVQRTGRTVAELFAESGEAHFREVEARATLDIAVLAPESPGVVVAAGGGWMANRAARTALPTVTTVWLRVAPAEAARRLGPERPERPLLVASDPAVRLAALLAERLPAYREATYTVDTAGRTPEAVAREVAAVVGLASGQRTTVTED
jgi:shikimate kinase